MKFYPYKMGRGGAGKASAMLKGGAKRFEVFLSWELEVLAILKGGHTKFPPFKRGGGSKGITVLRGSTNSFEPAISGPGFIPGSRMVKRHVSCILLLEWSTTSQRLWMYRIYVPYAQTDPRFLFKQRRGQP